MSWVAVGMVGGAALGAYINGQAAQGAADTQAGAADRASQMQYQIYQQQRADQEPFRQAGIGALNELQDNKFMNNWQQDPGYAFRMQEGNKALNNAAAARGLSNSGATLKALTRYGQDYSSGEYDKVYGRNMQRINGLLGLGSNANNANQQSSTNYGNNVGNNIMSAGNAQAAGQIATGNAWNSAISGAGNTWMNYQMMNRLFPAGNGGLGGSFGGSGYGSAGGGYGNFGNIA